MQRRLVVDVKSSVIVLLLSSVLSVVSPNSDVPVTLLITLLKYAANLPNVEWSHINVFCLPRHFRLILITFKILVRPFWNVEFGLTDELKSEEKIFLVYFKASSVIPCQKYLMQNIYLLCIISLNGGMGMARRGGSNPIKQNQNRPLNTLYLNLNLH